MINTRKIQLNIDEPDKDKRVAHWQQVRAWREIIRKAANQTMTHLYVQDNLKEFFYLADDVKMKLADRAKDPNGMFNTSAPNTIYRLLSEKYKGEVPMAIASSLGMQIHKTYKEEKLDVVNGDRNLRCYKKNIPIPTKSQIFTNWGKDEENYTFSISSIPFKTYFGRDRSNNRIILERALSGEYKFCDSAIMLDDTKGKKPKLFLLLCVDIPKTDYQPKDDMEVQAFLKPDYPIVATCGKQAIEIGSADQFTYRRKQIQAKLRKLQVELRYANGGKGRKSKLQAIDRYHLAEKNYVTTQLHTYSIMLVRFAEQNRAKCIKLVDLQEEVEKAKEQPQEAIIRNWSYYGLQGMIEYKAKRLGIEVQVL